MLAHLCSQGHLDAIWGASVPLSLTSFLLSICPMAALSSAFPFLCHLLVLYASGDVQSQKVPTQLIWKEVNYLMGLLKEGP